MTFTVGNLVKARGREWVVLPQSDDNMLVLRPLGGTDDEIAGIYLPLETVESATFAPPDPDKPGDFRSCRLLRDALRLGFRSSAGPFRCYGQIAVEPRPYQLVPLLMALKLDPVRLLIADDVGIGKTVEAALVARELMDRGDAQRLAILCPPHLAEQWQAELSSKFHIQAELVLPSTASRLERGLPVDKTIFDFYPHVIVSTDFIKTDRRRDDFLRTCPELVIVDEAHTCAGGGNGRGGRHQRHHLIAGLAKRPERHLILVTATPHSGNEDAFRSLLGLLDPSFATLPEDLTGAENESHRRTLARHMVQRRRADIKHFMKTETPFPDREESEASYTLSAEYKKLFTRVLNYARETVQDEQGGRHRQRVRWWSALALLRSLASSPAAAASTLRNRAAAADTLTPEEADDVGRRSVLDLDVDEDASDAPDVAPGCEVDPEDASTPLKAMAREAEKLKGNKDEKLLKATRELARLLKDGFHPIVFCRFIPTAEYVAAELRARLPKGTEVVAVTGTLPPAEREERVLTLKDADRRVLVCTDCLSEGINLQEHFDAVFHYDLSWNPTRHEQREGRVDRYGQPRPKIRVLTYFGTDNQIDGIVLDVLLRKHRTIRSSLGVSVPVPVDTNAVVEAIFEGVLLRGRPHANEELILPGFEDYIRPAREDLYARWEDAADRERRSRTMFAQEGIGARVEEVTRELEAARRAVGSGADVAIFVEEALARHRCAVTSDRGSGIAFDAATLPRALRETMGLRAVPVRARFELPVQEGQLHFSRTHPAVEGLASYVLDTALDARADGVARRCGAIRTRRVQRRTTLLLVRFRYHIVTIRAGREEPLLAEDCQVLAFEGAPAKAAWLEDGVEALLEAAPEDSNVPPEQATDLVRRVLDPEAYPAVLDHVSLMAERRAVDLFEAHQRVREASRSRARTLRVEAQQPPDVLGIYVYLPVMGAS